MQKLQSYEQYVQALASFKQGRAHCRGNRRMMQDELTALIEAGKLYYEQTGDTLWFFSDEDYFYYAHFYAPMDAPIQMVKQDKDVLVELMGNESRYDEQMDKALTEAGFEKRDKYLEHVFPLQAAESKIEKKTQALDAFWERKGFTCRTMTKADYPVIRALWLDRIGKDSYTVIAMTDAELAEMEQFGRCIVVCDRSGQIQAAEDYLKKNGISYFHLLASNVLGLGGWVDQRIQKRAIEEGCTKGLSWIRIDNSEMQGLGKTSSASLTGKFFWQFVCPARPNT